MTGHHGCTSFHHCYGLLHHAHLQRGHGKEMAWMWRSTFLEEQLLPAPPPLTPKQGSDFTDPNHEDPLTLAGSPLSIARHAPWLPSSATHLYLLCYLRREVLLQQVQ